MPFLSEEEVDDLQKKIDSLSANSLALEGTNKKLKEENQEKANKLRTAVAVCIILFLCLVGALVFGFGGTVNTTVVAQEPTVIRDTIFIEKKVVEKTIEKPVEDVVTYGVQIGAYKKFKVDFSSCVYRVTKGQLNFYVLGNFPTISEAKSFKKLLKDQNVKDTFIVKMKNGELVN
ncbi:SPOR domain-containing protein [Wenyingzhuangia sp. IMCC45574]